MSSNPAEREQSDGTQEQATSNAAQPSFLAVGRMVHVASRTWPGINKPGGVGRIVNCHYTGGGSTVVSFVDVQYIVMGGREKRVPVEYVQAATEYEQNNNTTETKMRDRSVLLGRCKRCGSLRTDCGSCDWIEQEELAKQQAKMDPFKTAGTTTLGLRRKRKIAKDKSDVVEFSSSESSSDDDELILKMVERNRQRQRRRKAEWNRFLNEDDRKKEHGDSDSEGEDEDPVIRRKVSSDKSRVLLSSSEDDEQDPILAGLKKLSSQRRTPRSSGRELAMKRRRRRRRQQSTGMSSLERIGQSESREIRKVQPMKEADQGTERTKTPVNDDLDSVGDPDLSPVRPASPRDDSSPIPVYEASQFPQSPADKPVSQFYQESPEDTMAYERGMYLEDFIQPEGERAAQMLPKDMIDRTKSVAFVDLPAFFDRTASQLEDEAIPDAKLQIAEFQRRLRVAESNGNLNGAMAEQLAQESQILYDDLVQNLIREGTDQCEAALRRLDSREYRIHKKHLSRKQKRELRGIGRESRDIRLNDLNEIVDAIMKKARDTCEPLGLVEDELVEGSLSEDEGDSYGSESEGSLGSLAQLSRYQPPTDDLTTLPTYDPHMHARASRKYGGKKRRKGVKVSRHGPGRSNTKRTSAKHEDVSEGSQSSLAESKSRKRRRRGVHQRASGQSAAASFTDPFKFYQEDRDTEFFALQDDRDVPSLDDMLGATDDVTQFEGMEGRSSHRNRAPASERMTSFLAANSSIFSDDGHSSSSRRLDSTSRVASSGTSVEPPRGHKKKSTKTTSRARSTTSTQIPVNNADSGGEDTSRDEEDDISVDSLYDRLGATRSPSPDQVIAAAPSSRTTPDLCNLLQQNYPSSPSSCHSAFALLLSRVKTETENVQEQAVEILDTALQLLQTSGNFTLLEVIHFRRDLLPLHVGLLVFILRIMETCTDGMLSRNGAAFEIFGSPGFLSSIRLQLVDAVYALALPSAWVCDAGNGRALLEQLTPLRDALHAHCSLPEEACRLVVEALECQQWRKSGMGDDMFVSSVDPRKYSELIANETTVPSPPASKSRYAHFQGTYPRCEINAIWLLLAYFADGSPSKAIDTSFRWRMIASLFYSDCGVLSKPAIEPSTAEDKALSPSNEHLAACESELSRFVRLLTIGALDPLPVSDGFIVKLSQKALTLQNAAFVLSDTAASLYLPQTSIRDLRRYVNAAWERTSLTSRSFEASVGDANSSTSLDGFCKALRGTTELCGPSALPSSRILRLAIESLAAWIGRMPAKKARSARFNTALQGLVDDLISLASQLKSGGSDGPTSSFSAAFGSAAVISGNDAGEAFLKEAAVQFVLVGALSRQQIGLPPGIREKVWDIVGDSELEERRKRCIESTTEASTPAVFAGNILLLYVAAKSTALTAFLEIGVHPSIFDEKFLGEIHPLTKSSNLDEGVLVYYTSCLVACLECIVDGFSRNQHGSVGLPFDSGSPTPVLFQVIAEVCFWTSIIFSRAKTALLKESDEGLQSASTLLGQSCLSMISRPASRCLAALSCAEKHDSWGGVAMRSLLAMVRGAVALTSITEKQGGRRVDTLAEPQAVASQVPEDDDFFGSMDDSLFLELNEPSASQDPPAQQPCNDQNCFGVLWKPMVELLEVSMPSKRFTVIRNSRAKDQSILSSASIPGRAMAADNAGQITSCLSALVAIQASDASMIDTSLDCLMRPVQNMQVTTNKNQDVPYLTHVAQSFFSEVCRQAEEYPLCDALVIKRRDEVFKHFVEAVLDCSAMERFPTANVDRMRRRGGEAIEAKEKARLSRANQETAATTGVDLFRDAHFRRSKDKEGSIGAAYNSAHVWSFYNGLRTSLNGEGQSPKTLLPLVDDDLPNAISDELFQYVCLESETLKRIMLFRTILAKSTGDASDFEQVSRLSILTCSKNLLSISEGLRYHEGSQQQGGGIDHSKTHRHSKLLELQSCYCELTVTIFSFILSNSSSRHDQGFLSLLRFMRDNVLSRILQRHAFDLHGSLRELYYLALGQETRTTVDTSSRIESLSLQEELFGACIRRSQDFIRYIALDRLGNVYSFHHAIVSAAMENDVNVVKAVANAYYSQTAARSSSERSLLEGSVDKYLDRVRAARSMVSAEMLASAKRFALDKFVVGRLNQANMSIEQKEGALRLLLAMLQNEHDVAEGDSSPPSINRQLLCSMCKGLVSCLCALLELPRVDDSVASLLFACARLAITLPYQEDDVSRTSFLRWSQSTPSREARYVGSFALWIKELAAILAGQSIDETGQLTALRKVIADPIKNSSPERQSQIITLYVRLKDLEKAVFATKENVPPVANMYAKTKKSQQLRGDSSSEWEWKPNSAVRRVAKEFLADVISVL